MFGPQLLSIAKHFEPVLKLKHRSLFNTSCTSHSNNCNALLPYLMCCITVHELSTLVQWSWVQQWSSIVCNVHTWQLHFMCFTFCIHVQQCYTTLWIIVQHWLYLDCYSPLCKWVRAREGLWPVWCWSWPRGPVGLWGAGRWLALDWRSWDWSSPPVGRAWEGGSSAEKENKEGDSSHPCVSAGDGADLSRDSIKE